MKKQNNQITCRVLGNYEIRRYEYFMRERNYDSRSMYFGCPIKDESITKLVDHMIANNSHHKVIVAEDEYFDVVGTIHIAIINNTEVELGVMVSEAYRGLHISTKMMDFALNWCRNRGFLGIYMHCLSYNAPLLHLVKKYGLEITSQLGDSEAVIKLPSANIFTLGRENLDVQQAILKQNVMSFKKMLHL
jgi:RimJ/RimL family protein N-acetyltransferase